MYFMYLNYVNIDFFISLDFNWKTPKVTLIKCMVISFALFFFNLLIIHFFMFSLKINIFETLISENFLSAL